MALLERLQTRTAVALSSRHIVGRSRASMLRLESTTVSGAHALIEWSAAVGWTVRDLGSKNGTFVDGKRLASDSAARLITGTRVAFGGESEVWRVIDDQPPGPVARSRTGEFRFPEHGMMALPGPERPEVTIFVEEGRCYLEGAAAREELLDGFAIEVGNATWTLFVPELLRETTRTNRQPSLR